MKSIKIYLTLLLMATFLFSCNKDDDDAMTPEVEYLIFGHFYGECMGETCVEIFKLEGEALFEDSNDTYPGSGDFYQADFTELTESEFQIADGLMDDFPMTLLDEAEVVIGLPDAGDWGGLYIEYKKDDVHDFWLLDQMKDNVPEAYHTFIDKVNEKIGMINQ